MSHGQTRKYKNNTNLWVLRLTISINISMQNEIINRNVRTNAFEKKYLKKYTVLHRQTFRGLRFSNANTGSVAFTMHLHFSDLTPCIV